MSDLHTEILGPDQGGIARAAGILCRGGLVAFPTETVYGLGADARDDRAVAGIFAAKNRPSFNPLIVHVPDLAAAERIAVFSDTARDLAQAFWPGALTLVLPLRADAGIAPLVSAGLDSIAIRVPAHPLARDLLRACGCPLAAPSANPSGRVSPTRANHVMAGLSGRIDAVLDGGAADVGVESTIIGLAGAPRLLRPGGVPVEAIEACLGQPLNVDAPVTDTPNAPGQLESHYAPGAGVRLNVTQPDAGELWLGFGPDCAGATRNLSPAGDLTEAAANLFGMLRDLDDLATAGQGIAVAPVPDHGLGRAINDRLRRAAAPRPG
ncbi:L-threonylcarbamoyladenylate synthase [Actibacterium ureilyticum]|uniref:L-threonylcarbamoyladenylate synthase n=1 Tax=Actibacterium ureilyticum TaxID=1590614 RepID=UPI000BAAD81E|nr:L-threonylcarbamoyladenylate synthase [Actibacterium ureilyticum]